MVNKSIRKIFSYVGWSYSVFALISYGFVLLVSLVYSLILSLDLLPLDMGIQLTAFFQDKLVQLLLSAVSMYLIAFPVLYLMIRGIKAYPPEKKKLPFSNWVTFFFIAVFMMTAGALIGNLCNNLISVLTGSGPISNSTIELLDQVDFGPSLVIAVVIGPVIEELMFRKFLIDRLSIFGEKKVIVLSALMFGIFHGNLYQFFYAFGLGLLLAYIYVRTGKIRNTIILHMSANFLFGLLPMLIMNRVNISDDIIDRLSQGDLSVMSQGNLFLLLAYLLLVFIEYIGAIVGFILLLLALVRRRLTFKAAPYEIPKGMAFRTIYLAVGMIVFFLIFIGITVYALTLTVS